MKHPGVATGIHVNNNKILCIQRGVHKYSYLNFKYESPRGKVKQGETKPGAFMRELDEELRLKISI